ncbi:MAG TPA: hypothetical protein PLQ32_01880 [Flavihumibacter sp.]|nr:hypothetical protein [Flavihumibacter sp.]
MKNICSLLLAACMSLAAFGQNAATRVPDNAPLVIKYASANMTRELPLKKIDSYGFMRQQVFKLIGLDSLSSLENTGIDFSKDCWQYFLMGDSATGFVTLLPLKNQQQFLQTLSTSLKKELTATKTTPIILSRSLPIPIWAGQISWQFWYMPIRKSRSTTTSLMAVR